MSPAEIQQLLGGYDRNKSGMNIPDDIGQKWQDLETQLTRAGNEIQTALAGSLVNITPGLTHLSETFVHLVDVVMARPELKAALKRLGDGMEWLADEIGIEGVPQLKKGLDELKMSAADFATLNNWLSVHWNAFAKWLPTHVEGAQGFGADDHGRQYQGGRAGEGGGASRMTDPRVEHALGGTPAPPILPGGGGVGLRGHRDAPTGRGDQDVPAFDAKHVSADLDDRSKRELSGVNKPLAEDLLEASKQSGIKFAVNQGRRTQEEAKRKCLQWPRRARLAAYLRCRGRYRHD